MSTGRVNKYKKGKGYESLPRELLQDSNLSLEAIGLLANLQSYPDNWKLYKTELTNRFPKNKKSSINRIWDELVDCGYLIQFRRREGRSYYYEYFFSVVKFNLDDVKDLVSAANEKQLLLYHKDMLKETNMKTIDQISYLPLDDEEKELIRKDPNLEFLIWGSENQNLKKEGEISIPSSSDFENPKLDIPKSEHSKSTTNRSTINMSHSFSLTDDDDYIYNTAHEKLVQLSQINPKVTSIAKYLFATGLDIVTIVATLDIMIADESLLNGTAIVQQMTWCIKKANSGDGISDFPVYFVNGLRKQVQFRNIQSDTEFETSLKVEVGEMIDPDKLPQVPMYNWLNPGK